MIARIERNVSEIRWDDLVGADEIAFPTERTILRLEQRSGGAAEVRLRQLQDRYTQAEEANEALRSQRDTGDRTKGEQDWMSGSEEALFVRKRAETLADLLDAKRTFQALNWSRPDAELLETLLAHPNGLRTLNVAL